MENGLPVLRPRRQFAGQRLGLRIPVVSPESVFAHQPLKPPLKRVRQTLISPVTAGETRIASRRGHFQRMNRGRDGGFALIGGVRMLTIF